MTTTLIDVSNELTDIYKKFLPYKIKYLKYCHDLDYDGKIQKCNVCGKDYVMDPSQIFIFTLLPNDRDQDGIYICPNIQCQQQIDYLRLCELTNQLNDYITSLKQTKIKRSTGVIEENWLANHIRYNSYLKCIFVPM